MGFKGFLFVVSACFLTGMILPLLGISRIKSLAVKGSLLLALAGGVGSIAGALSAWSRAEHPFQENLFPGIFVFTWSSNSVVFPGSTLTFYFDRLSLFFVILVGFFTILVSLYSLEWLKNVPDAGRTAGILNLFVLLTLGTLLCDDVFFYFLFLEAMTLVFSFLVLYRHNKALREENDSEDIAAGKLAFQSYLIFSHVGVMLALAGFLILSVCGSSFSFSIFRGDSFVLPPGLATLVFFLTLFGFGIKAGMFPSHIWVPMVHPQSPTNIHAMLSGVILKVAGVYGILRVFFEFLKMDTTLWWWGWVVMILAGATALVGVFYALFSHDLKTALASHSVENIGIIFVGIGAALVFRNQEQMELAGLALMASLYHLVNHSIFKGLLFLCVGAIENRTGTVKIEKLGGLMRIYPFTSTAFLVGAISIAGFPPFNGFISEWLTLQSVFFTLFSPAQNHWLPASFLSMLVLLLLIISFALTAFAFVKIAGLTVLGAPRDLPRIQQSPQQDVPVLMRIPLGIFAALCLLLGIFPSAVLHFLAQIVSGLSFGDVELAGGLWKLVLTIQAVNLSGVKQAPEIYISGILIFCIAAIFLASILWAIQPRSERRTPAWTGGEKYPPDILQATGAAFTSLIWSGLHVRADRTQDKRPILPYQFRLTQTYSMMEYFRKGYDFLLKIVIQVSKSFGNWFQNGDIRRYLGYIFVMLILMLLLAAVLKK